VIEDDIDTNESFRERQAQPCIGVPGQQGVLETPRVPSRCWQHFSSWLHELGILERGQEHPASRSLAWKTDRRGHSQRAERVPPDAASASDLTLGPGNGGTLSRTIKSPQPVLAPVTQVTWQSITQLLAVSHGSGTRRRRGTLCEEPAPIIETCDGAEVATLILQRFQGLVTRGRCTDTRGSRRRPDGIRRCHEKTGRSTPSRTLAYWRGSTMVCSVVKMVLAPNNFDVRHGKVLARGRKVL
jgi:hypothetical protein